ncbi:diguanylate cyclase (GGDEF)-like protein/PAS domain S-box-containing protein [Geodermatophilus bullaregiensis]|uniref:histidine kinase N-terminal 7TM domain-containing diguanylate cyclase n=1 Tax=Geodermatophilus bullaregiensis TaxID=1564160 RepID=UPI001958D450|nr:diguanylate cyclase [Geodermatophilus bullaregiensis]MBM7808578.1 diguanylate cyclase (GGDEF)-like protein/PAS domain S-box-containing protein [Geodermatophilus bullaregiensis]
MTTVLQVVFCCAALVAVCTAVLAHRHRHRTPAATALTATMAGVALWSATDAAVLLVGSDVVHRLYAPVLLAAISLAVVGTYATARTVSDPSWRATPRTRFHLAVVPVLVVLAAALPATRELVMTDVPPGPVGAEAQVTLGPLFLAATAYNYVLTGTAYGHLVRRWVRATGVFRRQIGVLLASAAFSSTGGVVAVVSQLDGQGTDPTPLFLLVTGLVDCWALFRLGLLRVVPVAREQVVDTVPDAVLVVDPAGLVIDVNPAATRMLHRLRPELAGELVGRPLVELAGPQTVAVLDRTEQRNGHRVAEVVPGLWLDVRASGVSDPRGRALGRILVVRDVSEQQERQAAVERLNEQLAEQVAVIERLRAELAEEAVRDPLTGLHNRRHLDRALAADLARRPRSGELSVLVVDVDHFKRVNDRFGHAAGDRVLTAVAAVLDGAVREGDTAARLGGEEFVLVLPGAGRAQALERAERVRSEIAAARHLLGGEALAVTASVGVAVCPSDGADAAALLEAADRALYTAKATGRDRVVAAAAGAPVPELVPGG